MRFVFSFILLTGSKLLASVLILYYVMMHFPALINTHTHTYMHHAMCFCCLFIIIHTFSYLLSFSGFALIPYGVQYFFCVIKESTNPSYRSASNTGGALAENNYYYSGQKRKSKKLLVLGSYDIVLNFAKPWRRILPQRDQHHPFRKPGCTNYYYVVLAFYYWHF